jgi:hypothetical protein
VRRNEENNGGKKWEDKRKVTRIDEGTGKREMWTGER